MASGGDLSCFLPGDAISVDFVEDRCCQHFPSTLRRGLVPLQTWLLLRGGGRRLLHVQLFVASFSKKKKCGVALVCLFNFIGIILLSLLAGK